MLLNKVEISKKHKNKQQKVKRMSILQANNSNKPKNRVLKKHKKLSNNKRMDHQMKTPNNNKQLNKTKQSKQLRMTKITMKKINKMKIKMSIYEIYK